MNGLSATNRVDDRESLRVWLPLNKLLNFVQIITDRGKVILRHK
jgi:hypothetical protein